MNKKLFLGMFAAAGMLLATSCSNDELDVVQSGNEAQVTFSLAAEGGIATRAISDGTGAKKLVYAVYNANGELIKTIANADVNGQIVDNSAFDNGLTENVTITLAKGQQYTVAFWAQNPNCTAYTTTDLKNVKVDYAGLNNDETRDAFYAAETFKVEGNKVINVTLKRPFAQINVGVTKEDWEAANASGITIAKSSVVIKNAATSINLLTGEVGAETTDVPVTYTANNIPQGEMLKVDTDGDGEDEEYHWLSMSYILVADRNADTDNSGVLGDERATLESLQYTFYPESGNNITFGDGLNSVPVERNWRTNILGQILTGDIQFNITINPIFEGDINVDAPTSEVKSDAQALAAALTANEEDILVVLGEDVNLPINLLGSQTPGSGEYKLGGADTKNITIDLNGKTLNLTTSYMSAIGAKNADATITIKNGAVTSTGNSATTWNINDVTFANCNYVIENVTFNKEVALTNAGKSVTMNDVTINGTGDYYALWISAKGQTVKVDNLKINTSGRGIKIDEQYVGAPAKVTLDISNSTFKTTKKAAIMVKSVEGADITVSDIDISNVTADKVFAVWVDEDAKANADKVVVNGALMKVEGDNAVIGAASTEELANATIGNNATIYLAAGDYIIPSTAKGKTLTIKGTGNPEDVKVAVTKVGTGGENCDYGFDGSTVTFEGITITTNSSTYIGYARCKGTYKNCVINGTYTLYDDSKFENCTFNVSGDVYNIWTWGAPNATFDKCTFNSDGKAMLLYGTVNTNLTIENSVFNDKGGLTDLKAAIEIGNDYSKSYILVVNNTVVNGYEINDKGINTGTTLWANKNSMGTDKLSVTIDGVKVY